MKLYNSLGNDKQEFTPIEDGKVSMYHCGPTVYDYIHIGNLRSFLLGDLLRRTFEYLGYEVTQVMNITDVGHLVSDGDDGDDKMTKALKREGRELSLKNMLNLADFYADAFKQDLKDINMLTPQYFPKASEHVADDITLIRSLLEKEHAYIIDDGIYFDTTTMQDYGVLGGLNHDETIERVVNVQKKHPADFALWKFDSTNGWKSPWGQGFPGWHIECSAMGIRLLGEQFDIHTGGSDLKAIHHNNEIAQSQCGTGKVPFVNYWLHGEMLNMSGEKLSKSTGGNITLNSLREQNLEPLAYRYLTLQTHYRSPMNFSFEALQGAQTTLNRIRNQFLELKNSTQDVSSTIEFVDAEFQKQFQEYISDDINMPKAVALLHEVLKSDLDDPVKLGTIYNFDRVLGLNLKNYEPEALNDIPNVVNNLLLERQQARNAQDWKLSDELRTEIANYGYEVIDNQGKQELKKM